MLQDRGQGACYRIEEDREQTIQGGGGGGGLCTWIVRSWTFHCM